MATIREIFHEIGNWHNKISVGAGVTRELLKKKHNPERMDKDTLIKRLDELEQYAIGADETLIKLKERVYEKIDPDTD